MYFSSTLGARCYSVLEHLLMVQWVIRSIMVVPVSFISFQPVLHDWCVLSCLWDGVYKRTLAANWKV